MTFMSDDIVEACAHLVDRSGASGFELGYLRDDVPVEEAGWYAFATFKGARVMVDEHRSPTAAALGLAERLLRDATCRCGELVQLSDSRPGCRWRLVGNRWTPGCDAPPVRVEAARGDYAALTRAMTENRATRRAAKHKRGQR